MFTTAHFASGVALGLALGLDGPPLVVFVLASVFTDWDYALQLATGRNHRTFLSHSPPVVAAVLGVAGVWQPLAWWALAGTLLHFSLDIWEYGLRLNPFSRKIYGFRLLPGTEDMRFAAYARTYFSDRRFLTAEVLLALAALVAIVGRVFG